MACNHLEQLCRQLPPHTAASQLAGNSTNSPNACTGLQEPGSARQLTTLHASEQLDSTAAAPESGMPTPNSSSVANSVHSKGEVLRLLAQGAVVSAAAVAAMRPNVIAHDRAKPLLECLVKLAMQLPEGRSQEACMVAAAAVINKWSPGGFSRVWTANTLKACFMCQTLCNSRLCNSKLRNSKLYAAQFFFL